MTLSEIMVGMGVGFLTLAGVITVFLTSSFSFVRMGNYLSMDMASRKALDQMSRDIRRSKDILYCDDSRLVLKADDAGNQLIYTYDDVAGQLTQWRTGGDTNVILSHCAELKFRLWNNSAVTPNGIQPDKSPGAGFNDMGYSWKYAKSITIAWTCSKSILGGTKTSEDMQQALIVIRNKPAL